MQIFNVGFLCDHLGSCMVRVGTESQGNKCRVTQVRISVVDRDL